MSQLYTKMWIYPDKYLATYRDIDDINVNSLNRALPRLRKNNLLQPPAVYLETTNPTVVDKLKSVPQARLIYNGWDKLWKYQFSLRCNIDLYKYLAELTGSEVYKDELTEGVITIDYSNRLKKEKITNKTINNNGGGK